MTQEFCNELASFGEIDRCDVSCGFYGDSFVQWRDNGKYVEYEDHAKLIAIYERELERLKKPEPCYDDWEPVVRHFRD